MNEQKYDLLRPWRTLDDWQKKYIETDGNCFLLTGRQVGKSTAMSIKAARRALKNPNRNILIIAFTEKQAYEIFFKTLNYIQLEFPQMIKGRPTMHEIELKNGSIIMCYATGLAGHGIRGFTIHHLFVDEAQSMAREVFIAVMPMLAVTGGSIDIAGTPAGKVGYFYECSDDAALGPKKRDDFTRFFITAEQCPRHDKKHLEAAKKAMSAKEYAQEYLAQFLDDIMRVFPEELVKKCCTRDKEVNFSKQFKYYLGVDIARMGEDLSSFQVIRKIDKEHYEHCYSEITRKTLTTQTEKKIIELDKIYNFKKIAIDAGSGSLGVGIYDHLINEPKLKDKVVAINNREVSSKYDDKVPKFRLLKEDLYFNLLRMMEKGQIKLLNDDEVAASLSSVQWENVISPNKLTKTRIFGKYTHTAEGLIRAAFEAMHDTSLNLFVA